VHNRYRFPLWRMSLSRFLARLTAVKLSIASVAAFLLWLALAQLWSLFYHPPPECKSARPAQVLVPVKADATKKPAPSAPVSHYLCSGLRSLRRPARRQPAAGRPQVLKRNKIPHVIELTEASAPPTTTARESSQIRRAIIIPGILESVIVEKPVPVARDFEVRAIYLTGIMAGSDHGVRIIGIGAKSAATRWSSTSRIARIVNIASDNPLASGHATIFPICPSSFASFIRENMHAILASPIFRDEHLVTSHPETRRKVPQQRPALARERQTLF